MELSPVAIYIHWPWCKAKCPYCDFNSHESTIQEEAYVDALILEMESWRKGRTFSGLKIPPFTPGSRRITSIFFGGGTPSLMRVENVGKLIQKCRELGVLDSHTEITVECNPTSFHDDRPALTFFQSLQSQGVNRISIGIQGLNQDWLDFLGRTHHVNEALATLDAAQTIFDNVNADVIYGLPNQHIDDWKHLLNKLASRGLSHISAYQLTIEKNTKFYKDVQVGRWEPISSDVEADFFECTRDTLRTLGYENYEISNFAKSGKACQHNVHVWQYGEYLGVGAGAHGRVISDNGIVVATQVVRQPEGYLRRTKELGDCISDVTPLSGAEAAQEAVFSGLRLATGIDMETALKRFGEGSCKEAFSDDEIRFLIRHNLLEMGDELAAPYNTSCATTNSVQGQDFNLSQPYICGSEPHTRFLRLTNAGWPRLNSILGKILRPLPKRNNKTTHWPVPQNSAYTTTLTVVIK